VDEVYGNRVRLGFEAPKHVSIKRGELEHDDLGDPELGEKPAEWFMKWELDAAPC